jgi:hypothetical protein
MRKAFLVIPTVLVATLIPSVSNAEVHMCRGKVATIVGTRGDDDLTGTTGNYLGTTGGDDYQIRQRRFGCNGA